MSAVPADDARSQKQFKRDQKRSKRDRKQLLTDLRAVLGSEQGMRVMWHILGMCGMHDCPMTGNSWTYFRLGEQNIGVQLQVLIEEADDEAYIKMLQSALEKKRELDAQRIAREQEAQKEAEKEDEE